MRSARLILTVCFLTLSLTACSEKESDKIADAQSCLDTATAATAASCVAKVDGIESKGAYLIRCVGKFVEEGFNSPTRLSSALSQINSGGGANQSLEMMAVLYFSAGATMAVNKSNAQEAFSFCNQGGSKGLILLSGLAQTATTVAEVAGLAAGFDGTDLDGAMAAVAGNPAAQAAVGEAATAIYNSSCVNSSTDSPGEFCTQFSAAVAANGGDTNGIGQFVMNCYANPGTPGCTGF